VRHGRIGFWYRLAVSVVKPPLLLFTRRDWRGRGNLPTQGGVIIAANHVAHLDPLTLAQFLYDSGRLPRYLAKAELFRVPFVGRLVNGCGQIPVHRGTADANAALRDAVAALQRGECLVIYPEGTITRDPEGWPMKARTGVARLALLTGAPVIPVGQWGAQFILPAYTKRPHLLPRKVVRVAAGPPVDLSLWMGAEPSGAVLREITDRIMAEVRQLVGELRGETPPSAVFERRSA
jgi:1-acyl-sn-glycerol-3-phosphate acyltransferase